VMNRALLELQGAAHLRRGVLPLCGHLSDLQSVNVGSYVQSCCYHKFAQVPHCIAPIADNAIIAQFSSCPVSLRYSHICSHTCMQDVGRRS